MMLVVNKLAMMSYRVPAVVNLLQVGWHSQRGLIDSPTHVFVLAVPVYSWHRVLFLSTSLGKHARLAQKHGTGVF